MDISTIAEVGTGAIGGGIGVAWIARVLIVRYLERTDKKHDDQDSAIRQLSKDLADVNTGIRVIEARIGETMSLRDDVKNNVRGLAVAETKIQEIDKDLGRGFQSVRNRLDATEEEIEELKSVETGS